MTRRNSADVGFLLIDGYDILGVSTGLEDNMEAALQETHALGDGWVKQQFTGLKKAEISQEGFFDDAADSSNAALQGKEGLNRLLCYGLEGNTAGRHFIGYQGAMQSNYTRIATRGELHRANASYKGSGEVEEGIILHTHATQTEDGDSDAIDNGAASISGGVAYLQVSALTLGGYTNALVKVLHSDDGIVWAELLAFTAVTAAPAKERKTVTGTIKQYLAVSWEFTGAGTDPSVKFFAGLKRN